MTPLTTVNRILTETIRGVAQSCKAYRSINPYHLAILHQGSEDWRPDNFSGIDCSRREAANQSGGNLAFCGSPGGSS